MSERKSSAWKIAAVWCWLFVCGAVTPAAAQPAPAAPVGPARPGLPNDPETLKQQGRQLYDKGDFAASIPVYEKAVAAATKQYGAADQKTDIIVNELARSHYSQGNYKEAVPHYRRVLENTEKRNGPNHTEVATCLNNLALVYDAFGDYEKAEELYLRSNQILAAALGANHPDLATNFNNLAGTYRDLGDYARSLALYLQSKALYERQQPRNEVLLANSLNNLGNIYSSLGQTEESERHFREAIKIRSAKLGLEHPSLATTYNSLAALLEDLGRFDESEDFYTRALAIREKKLGPDHPDVARSLNNLSSLYRVQGKLDAALKLQLKAIAIEEAKFGPEHISVASKLNNLAGLYKEMKQEDKALAIYERSLKIRRDVFGDEHPEVAQSYHNLGHLYSRLKQWEKAADAFDHSRRIVRKYTAQILPALSEPEQLNFLQVVDESYLHGALAMAYEQREDPAVAELSAGWVLNSKGVAQQAIGQKETLARDLEDPKIGALVAELTTTRLELVRLSKAGKKVDPQIKAQIEQAKAQEERLVRSIATLSGRTPQKVTWVETADVRKALPDGAVLVQIARFRPRDFQTLSADKNRWSPPRYAAWIIPAVGKGNVRIVDLGDAAEIEKAVKVVRNAIESAPEALRESGEGPAEEKFAEATGALAKLVFYPWLDQIGTADSLVLNPDASLWLVPWAALPLADKKYAVEKYQISYVISGRDLTAAADDAGAGTPPVIIADPDYDLTLVAANTAMQTLYRGQKVRVPRTRYRPAVRIGKVGRLAGTAAEAAAIAPKLETYAGQTPHSYMTQFALEVVLKTIHGPKVVVIGTHGFFQPADDELKPDSWVDGSRTVRSGKGVTNPLLRCGLLMAGCNTGGAGSGQENEDGILTGMEIVRTDLRGTELVVLSACQTGLGDVRTGEGVAGLRQAFQLAGAKTVLATLWEIPDADSARLMIEFFTQLADGKSRASALRAAQIARINSRRERRDAAHPFFWGAFTLTGQP